METTLFLLCPTDCLESKINEEFKGDNLFYSSLANNYSFDSKTIRDIGYQILVISYDSIEEHSRLFWVSL